MTFEEFDSTKWRAGMIVIYKGKKYPIAWVDFDERLLGLEYLTLEDEYPVAVRCEGVTLDDRLH